MACRAPLVLVLLLTLSLPAGTQAQTEAARDFARDALVLSAASLGGLWLGAQAPFDPADDDSDFSVWHLVTGPVASAAAVSVAAIVMDHGPAGSVRAAVVGAGAGIAAGLLTSMVAGDGEILVSYAVVHGVVTALKLR